MKKLFLASILSLFLSSFSFSQHYETVEIDSKELDQKREIIVYTPMNYSDAFLYFNVIYVFDAHDRPLFDYVNSVAHLTKEGHEGFIVVGIKATYDPVKLYARNHDFLPSTTSRNLGPKSKGNAENFLKYIKNEVIPYLESNYRTLPHRTAVGHSLGASFLIYSLLNETELFDNTIAISPNLADDDNRLVKGLETFDTSQFKTLKFLYMSHADEGTSENYSGWGKANEKAYEILRNDFLTDNFKVVLESYPDKTHLSGYMPAIQSALSIFINEIQPLQNEILTDETHQVTFRLKVPAAEDEVYITGNQESLGNWDPGKVKMKKVSDLVREITLEVQEPVKVKFTKGNWNTEAWMKIYDNDFGGTTRNRVLRPNENMSVELEVLRF